MNLFNKVILWHGSDNPDLQLTPETIGPDGLHVGTREQAMMRNSKALYEIEFMPGQTRRTQDCPDKAKWRIKIRSAIRGPYDTIVYLNRFEGMTSERVEILAQSGDLSKLDSCSDVIAKKLFPEARDSYLLLPGTPFRVKSRTIPTKAKRGTS